MEIIVSRVNSWLVLNRTLMVTSHRNTPKVVQVKGTAWHSHPSPDMGEEAVRTSRNQESEQVGVRKGSTWGSPGTSQPLSSERPLFSAHPVHLNQLLWVSGPSEQQSAPNSAMTSFTANLLDLWAQGPPPKSNNCGHLPGSWEQNLMGSAYVFQLNHKRHRLLAGPWLGTPRSTLGQAEGAGKEGTKWSAAVPVGGEAPWSSVNAQLSFTPLSSRGLTYILGVALHFT